MPSDREKLAKQAAEERANLGKHFGNEIIRVGKHYVRKPKKIKNDGSQKNPTSEKPIEGKQTEQQTTESTKKGDADPSNTK